MTHLQSYFFPSCTGRIPARALALVLATALLWGCTDDKPVPGKKTGAGDGRTSTAQRAGADTTAPDTAAPATAGTDSGTTAIGSGPAPAALNTFKNADPVTDAQAKYSLTLRAKVGQQFSYRITQKNFTEMQGMRISEESAYNFTAKVTTVNSDGSLAMEMQYDSIRTRQQIPPGVVDSVGKVISFDTRQKADPKLPGSQTYKALINQKVNVTISANGEIREISNVDPIVSAMLGKKRDSLSPAAISQLRDMLKVQGFASVLQQLFLVGMPSGDISPGQSWSRSDSVPLAGMVSRMTVNYRLAEVRMQEDVPVGNIVVGMTTVFPKKKIDNQQMKATINKADVHGNGSLLVNLSTGFPRHKTTLIEAVLDLTGEMKVGAEKGKTGNLSQRTSNSTTVELLNWE